MNFEYKNVTIKNQYSFKTTFSRDNMKDFIKETLGEFDFRYIQDRIDATTRFGLQRRVVREVVLSGAENLEKLAGQQYILLSNHVSHMDYLLEPSRIPKRIGVENFPRIAAGKNIDNALVRSLAHLDIKRCGVFLIDREMISGLKGGEWAYLKYLPQKELDKLREMSLSQRKNHLKRKAKTAYLQAQKTLMAACFKQGDSFLVYPEGGRRAPKERLTNLKWGFASPLEESGADPLIIPTGITYDHPLEQNYYPILKFLKSHAMTRPAYFALDFALFVKRIYSEDRGQKGNCYIHFGEPVRKSQIATANMPGDRRNQIIEHCTAELKRAYEIAENMKRNTGQSNLVEVREEYVPERMSKLLLH